MALTFTAYRQALELAKAYATGRAGSDDPTLSVPADSRGSVRAAALEHLERLENNRLAWVDASCHRSGRDSTGALVESAGLTGSPEPRSQLPTTWEALVAIRSAR
jgi:hypothetical protein